MEKWGGGWGFSFKKILGGVVKRGIFKLDKH
jgi:hypothetical protein